MRSVVLAGVLAGLAACGPTGGLQLDIDASADPGATELWIYVGSGEGQQASIAGAGQTPDPLHDGKFWPLTFETADLVKLSGGHTATVSFAPGNGVERLTVVVVGLTNGVRSSVATKINAALRSDVVEIWDLVLEPADHDIATKTGKAVTWWGAGAEATTCVQAVDRSDKLLENVFIGVADDKDCDGRPAGSLGECRDDWFDAVETPTQDTLSCLEPQQIPDPINGTSQVCVFGARDCTDGRPDAEIKCSHAVPFCAPEALCSECQEDLPQDRFKCALGLDPEQTPTLPYVHCEIQVNTAVNPAQVCPQILLASAPNTIASRCAGPALYHPPEPFKPWASSAQIGNINLAFASENTAPSSCPIRISPSSVPMRTFDPDAFPAHGLVSVELDPGAGIVVPVVFDVREVPGCPAINDRTCSIKVVFGSGDTIQRCLQHEGMTTPPNP